MSLKNLKGSFQSPQEREKLYSDIANSSASFESEVKKTNGASEIYLKENDGSLTAEEKKNLNINDNVNVEDIKLDENEFYGNNNNAITEEDFMHEPHASEKEEVVVKKEDFTVTDDGTKICNICGNIVESPDIVTFSDEEIIDYMMGGRIAKKFNIGPVHMIIRSLTEREMDYCGELMAMDMSNESFPTSVEYNNRFSFYRLCFALVGIGKEGSIKPLIDPSKTDSRELMTESFKKKSDILKSYGHSMRIKINKKQIMLEESIHKAIEDQDRIKN